MSTIKLHCMALLNIEENLLSTYTLHGDGLIDAYFSIDKLK